ncbi:MAG: hypothetical protein A4E40_01415 [Methanoregulaceae archaeon PtaU1.Bin059]|nr:MAG: hypothetical protein A4E40_01415 [Methanoregulaceae archaeon PtaU1.Bin059]
MEGIEEIGKGNSFWRIGPHLHFGYRGSQRREKKRSGDGDIGDFFFKYQVINGIPVTGKKPCSGISYGEQVPHRAPFRVGQEARRTLPDRTCGC